MKRLGFCLLFAWTSAAWAADNDGDSYDESEDCDDNDASIYPTAPEQCNGIDDNCNGEIDENIDVTYWADADGDGYGDAAVTIEQCEQPSDYVLNSVDCDDTNDQVNPAAEEICDNNLDDNCNGSENEGCGESDTGSTEPSGEPDTGSTEPSGEPGDDPDFEPNEGDQTPPNVDDNGEAAPDAEGNGLGPAMSGGPESLKSTSGCGESDMALLLLPLLGFYRRER